MSNFHFGKIKLNLLIMLFVSLLAFEGNAQKVVRSRQADKEPKSQSKFMEKLWYGGGFNLGLAGNGYQSYFSLGISPMVGYKIIDEFSMGPRVGLNYTFLKSYDQNGIIRNANLWDYSMGIFARYKVFRNFFAHAEGELLFQQNPLVDYTGSFYYDPDKRKVSTVRTNYENLYLGIGYTSGGEVATEISLLYNVLEAADSRNLPFYFRFGITYKF